MAVAHVMAALMMRVMMMTAWQHQQAQGQYHIPVLGRLMTLMLSHG